LTNVIVFPLTLRPPGERKRRRKADVYPFPFGRRRHLVVQHARAMRGLSQAASEAYVEEILTRVCDELRAIGIDCESCRDAALAEFAQAIGTELYGPDFELQLEETAQ
jgi:Family of unknown function (DUF6074)